MRTEASNQAFRNPKNVKKRLSKKMQIHSFFKWEAEVLFTGATYPEVASRLSINESTAQKRCSDLTKEGKLQIIGTRKGYSVYIEANEKPKMTKTKAYDMAVKTFCDLETQQAVYNFVKNNT